MAKKLAIVAVETNLIGRSASPKTDNFTTWPFEGREGHTDEKAEIVACYVGDLNEAGAVKFLLRGQTTGAIRECYAHAFNVLTGEQS